MFCGNYILSNGSRWTFYFSKVFNLILQSASISNLKNFDFVQKMTFHYKVGRQIRNVNIDDIIYIATTGTPHKLEIVKTNGRG